MTLHFYPQDLISDDDRYFFRTTIGNILYPEAWLFKRIQKYCTSRSVINEKSKRASEREWQRVFASPTCTHIRPFMVVGFGFFRFFLYWRFHLPMPFYKINLSTYDRPPWTRKKESRKNLYAWLLIICSFWKEKNSCDNINYLWSFLLSSVFYRSMPKVIKLCVCMYI